MNRVKIVDIPALETDAEKIQRALQAFLLKVRKRKIASDLIGDDEHASDFGVTDFDAFAEELSEGLQLSFHDRQRIRERATCLATRRKEKQGLTHLKREEREAVRRLLPDVSAVIIETEHRADEIAADLHAASPWMAPATEVVWHALRRSARHGEPLVVPPVIVVGAPAVGKSRWARAVAAAVGVPYADIDAAAGTVGFSLVGTERGWSSAQPGRPVETMLSHRIANPIMVVDEICKASEASSTSGKRHVFVDALLTLLEPGTATSWTCPFYRVRFNMRYVSWILTANTIDTVPSPLLSRCQVVQVPEPDTAQLIAVAQREGAYRDLSPANMDAIIIAIRQAADQGRRLSLRDVGRMIARGEALEGKPWLQ